MHAPTASFVLACGASQGLIASDSVDLLVVDEAHRLRNRGETAKAIPLYKRELTGCAKHYGPMHNETKTSAFNLANYLEKVGETAAAEELVKEYALHAEAAEAAAAESK